MTTDASESGGSDSPGKEEEEEEEVQEINDKKNLKMCFIKKIYLRTYLTQLYNIVCL